jgi:ABC-type Fe3+-siderophore transport system permease subunit
VFFALVGAVFLAHWLLADPSYDESASQSEWPYVLFFSGVIALLALAVPLLARLAERRLAYRISITVAAGASIASVANIVEDGLQIGWFFLVFVLGTALMVLGLAALTIAIAFAGRGGRRLLALVSAGTLTAIILYVVIGGPLMLATWLTAAALALPAESGTSPSRTPRTGSRSNDMPVAFASVCE